MAGEGAATRPRACRRGDEPRDAAPVVWHVDRRHAIPIGESLPVAESLHRGILSLARRHFGEDAIPSVLSGRGTDERPMRASDQHLHKHVLVCPGRGKTIGRLTVWAPGGLTREEREVVTGVRLRWAGRFVALTPDPGEMHPSFAVARSWRSLTPYLPFNHVKPRGRNSVEGQVRRELVEFRRLGDPATVTIDPWTRDRFRLRRVGEQRGGPRPDPFDLRMTFAEPVSGPLVLGRYAHFSLGLMVPDDA